MSTITGTPSDMTHIDHHTGYTFYVGQEVFTKSAHGPYSRQTVVRMTATQVILEDEHHTRTRYSIKTRTKHGAVKSMYPSSIVGVVQEAEEIPAPEDRVIPRGPETEAEEAAEYVRRMKGGAVLPAPEDLDYSVGSQLCSTMELAYLPWGTLLVATKGIHEGTIYRVVRSWQTPQLLTMDRYGISQTYNLADTVEADHDMSQNNLTITWVPSDV